MILEEKIKNIFFILDKTDNIPVILSDPDKIIENFEFSLRIDPFLFIQLLSYSNLIGYGFANEICRIEEITQILDEKILRAVLKSNSVLAVDKTWYKEALFSFLVYPVYLSVSELMQDVDWLKEEEINFLTFMTIGFSLRRLFFSRDHDRIKSLSIKKNASIFESEKLLNEPSFIMLSNIFFSNKDIPVILPYYYNAVKIDNVTDKISFILTLLDSFLQTNFYVNNQKNFNIEKYINSMLKINISFKELFELLTEKSKILWRHIVPDDFKEKLYDSINFCYQYHSQIINKQKKIIQHKEEEFAELEELNDKV